MVSLCERPVRSRLPRGKRSGAALRRTPNGLSAIQACQNLQYSVKSKTRRALSYIVPRPNRAGTKSEIQSALLLTLSAIISRLDCSNDCSKPFAVRICLIAAGRSLFGFVLSVLSAGQSTLPSLFVAAQRWLLIPRSSFVV